MRKRTLLAATLASPLFGALGVMLVAYLRAGRPVMAAWCFLGLSVVASLSVGVLELFQRLLAAHG